MQDIKMIVTDLDGTFTNHYHSVNEENIKAVQYARERGVIVCAVTARNWNMAKWIIRKGGFDRYCVTDNGACILDTQTEKRVEQTCIDPVDLRVILEACLRAKTRIDVFSTYFTVSHSKYGQWDSFDSEEFLASLKEDEHAIVYMCDTIEEMMEKIGNEAELVSIHSGDDGELPDYFFRDIIQTGELSLTSSHEGCLDIMPFGCTKGQGARRLAERYRIDRENIMAFGDHYNDKGMLKWAGIGVAVGNANETVQVVADIVAPRNDEAGFAQTVYKYIK